MAGITETDSLVYLVLGIIYIVLAFGLFGGWNWVWYLAVILALVSIGAALWGWYLADFTLDALWNAFLAMIIPLIILWYLFRTNVRAFFFGT